MLPPRNERNYYTTRLLHTFQYYYAFASIYLLITLFGGLLFGPKKWCSRQRPSLPCPWAGPALLHAILAKVRFKTTHTLSWSSLTFKMAHNIINGKIWHEVYMVEAKRWHNLLFILIVKENHEKNKKGTSHCFFVSLEIENNKKS